MVDDDLLIDDENRDAYDDLIVSIEAKAHRLNLLIAVCDDASFRDEIIAEYEAELQPQIRCYRTTLARGEPSLRAAVAQLVKREEYLQQHNPAVITVTGAEQLHFLKLGKERSEQEIFFGYLQWTREGLREFPFAIVLWVTNQILVELMKKAPDFWSWRNGVFRFASRRKNTISGRELEPIRFAFSGNEFSNFNEDNDYLLPIEDLQKFIEDAEQRGVKDAALATLYFSLGNIYRKRLKQGEFQDYNKELELAIDNYRKAVNIQQNLCLQIDLACSLVHLSELYRRQGLYSETEALLQQALEVYKRLLVGKHPNIAAVLNNLANLYHLQGRYKEAELLYKQALDIYISIRGNEHPDVATTMNNLAKIYISQGLYTEAEHFLKNALELRQNLLGEEHPNVATSLNNLAELYHAQKRYSEAESLFNQALKLRRRILSKEHPDFASSLNNLAELYHSQEKYSEAETLFKQALELRRGILGEEHPDFATTLNNLAKIYNFQGEYGKACRLYLQALDILERRLGVDHPNTVTVRENLAQLRDRLSSEQSR